MKSFYGVDELYALAKPLHVLQPPTASNDDQFASVHSINYSPDGKLLLTSHLSGHVKIWDTSTWTLQRELIVSDKGKQRSFFGISDCAR